jgi:hypothetical protein
VADRMRHIWGGPVPFWGDKNMVSPAEGALVRDGEPGSNTYTSALINGDSTGWNTFYIDSSRVVPTGPENSPVSMSVFCGVIY